MNIFLTVLFYTFASSLIFVYGIGLERVFIHSENKTGLYVFILKTLAKLFLSVSVLWFINIYVLLPIGANFILPVISVLILSLLETADNILFSKFSTPEKKETVFSWALVFFILYEAGSYTEAVIIIGSACTGLLIFSQILNAIKQKTEEGNAHGEIKAYTLVLLGMGFLTTAFYVTDISWVFGLVK
ncbi:hypothetical protein [Treponema pedis]|uniref:Membrane protein n=1 Tax=Treponema pedis str. T A4 TaxID=1291379 RepID=S5ZQI1_9SPIR|nr:hypothetical protein [Treponema pedis]AGT44922.1 membrane protein [Treponema pedis str. T A4]